FIKPYSKLSEYCLIFSNSILPEYSFVVIEDAEFRYQFSKNLPYCQVDVTIELIREFTSKSIGTAQLCIHCNVFNTNVKESFYYQQDPSKKPDINRFVNKLYSN